MPSRLTLGCVGAAILAYGIFAGISINRSLVELPAWQETGALAWANFSRHADLSVAGTALYSIGAIAGTIFSIVAALSFRFADRSQPGAAAIPMYGAVLMAIAGLLVTTQAAPIMQSVPGLGQDSAALQQALNSFQFWAAIRGVLQVLAFLANVWSLFALSTLAAHPMVPTGYIPPPTTKAALSGSHHIA